MVDVGSKAETARVARAAGSIRMHPDTLTRIPNRRAFDEVAAIEFERSRRGGVMALLVIDIDHFKRFNDEHGHRIGDQALVVVGSILKSFADEMKQLEDREIFSARYGGEEFAVTLLDVAKNEAEELADIIRRKIERYNFVIRDPDGQILAAGTRDLASSGILAADDPVRVVAPR